MDLQNSKNLLLLYTLPNNILDQYVCFCFESSCKLPMNMLLEFISMSVMYGEGIVIKKKMLVISIFSFTQKCL